MTFVNSAAAGLALCRAVPGMNICFDVFHVWTEFDLHETVISNASLINLVQVSDFVLGDRTPARAVPGDGGIPLEEVIGWLLAAGYDGVFDLELNGPRIGAEGHLQAAGRSVQVLGAILERCCPRHVA
jgi:sugar phosphate isomerase/epimerase